MASPLGTPCPQPAPAMWTVGAADRLCLLRRDCAPTAAMCSLSNHSQGPGEAAWGGVAALTLPSACCLLFPSMLELPANTCSRTGAVQHQVPRTQWDCGILHITGPWASMGQSLRSQGPSCVGSIREKTTERTPRPGPGPGGGEDHRSLWFPSHLSISQGQNWMGAAGGK